MSLIINIADQGASQHSDGCALCYSRQQCAPAAGAIPAPERQLVGRRIRVARNGALYRSGDLVGNRFYVVHFGSFKTCRSEPGDGQRVTAFYLNADCLALDAIGQQRHRHSAIALEDSEVCEILYSSMQGQLPVLHRMLSQQLRREQPMAQLLRDASADQRLATFLLDLSERHRARGYSATGFLLRMTREDIANYLSLTRESVSRGLVRFQRNGLVELDGRNLLLRNLAALQQLTGKTVCPAQAA